MNILLTNIGDLKVSGNCIQVTADLARADLVIEEVIDLKGAEFVLQAIGEEAAINYLKANGFSVSLNSMFDFKAA